MGDTGRYGRAWEEPRLDARPGEDGLDGRLVRGGRASAGRERVERGQQRVRQLDAHLLRARPSGEGLGFRA